MVFIWRDVELNIHQAAYRIGERKLILAIVRHL